MKVVNALPDQLGGALSATNRLTTHGARFTVTFPVA